MSYDAPCHCTQLRIDVDDGIRFCRCGHPDYEHTTYHDPAGGACLGISTVYAAGEPIPPQLLDGQLRLTTGDILNVTAFLTTVVVDGLPVYELAFPSGAPIDVTRVDLSSLTIQRPTMGAYVLIALKKVRV